jgi:HAD superfamily phosphoserine phosphatase-like hydrolase
MRRSASVPTVVFDFDSTLIDAESLEEILRPGLAGRPDLVARVRAITDLGMAGRISFGESLRRRLAILAPTRSAVRRFAATAHRHLTRGMADLVSDLRARRVGVSIVSGAVREAILPVARRLGVPPRRVHGVRPAWGRDGRFLGLRPSDPFARSKAAGLAVPSRTWSRPRIAVGDGATDLELLRRGRVDRFVAFTEHARRAAVLQPGVPEARDVPTLRRVLEDLL